MSKGLSNILNSSTGKWIFVLVVVLLIVWALLSYSGSKSTVDTMYSAVADYQPQMQAASVQPQAAAPVTVSAPAATTTSGSVAAPVNGYALQTVVNPSDLLPQDQNSQWAKLNPVSNANPQLPDLLNAGAMIGLDTVGQTLKNANLQLRSDPIIVKQNVGPWNNSTFQPDVMRVPLELGCGQP